MSIFFSTREFFETSGNDAYKFSEELRDGIAGFACNLWSSFPGWMTQNSLPATSFARGFYNQMCSPIQPPVNAPSNTFTGGQCPGVQYRAQTVWNDNGSPAVAPTFPPNGTLVTGPILSMVNRTKAVSASKWRGETEVTYTLTTGGTAIVVLQTEQLNGQPDSPVNSLVREDGQPDNCGNPPLEYPVTTPTVNDLTTTINITNLDGVMNSYELTVNQIQTNYNFPIGFKLNGVNVTLDLSGITIHGSPQVTNVTLTNTPTSTDNAPDPPGTDGGRDGIGNSNDTVYDGQDYPTLPDFSNPETIVKVIEYVLCVDGVIQTVIETIKIIAPSSPLVDILLAILKNILEDICELQEEGMEATVGLPEWYGLKPGQDRQAIVYLWKEFINGKWQKPTYSSTVSNPRQSAIDDILTITVPDKVMGTFYATATMIDGSRIVATGDTEVTALNNFNFLYNQVDPAFQPTDINQKIVISENQRIQVKTVKLRQIEYYPDGKAAGISPSIRRVIKS